MDDIAVEDEKKPFDSVVGGHDEDTQPDPDEQIMTESGNGRVWMVKVPLFYLPLTAHERLSTAARYRAILWSVGPLLMLRAFH